MNSIFIKFLIYILVYLTKKFIHIFSPSIKCFRYLLNSPIFPNIISCFFSKFNKFSSYFISYFIRFLIKLVAKILIIFILWRFIGTIVILIIERLLNLICLFKVIWSWCWIRFWYKRRWVIRIRIHLFLRIILIIVKNQMSKKN